MEYAEHRHAEKCYMELVNIKNPPKIEICLTRICEVCLGVCGQTRVGDSLLNYLLFNKSPYTHTSCL